MFDLTKLMISLILGMVEGITEFLPISSTSHMVLVEKNFLNYLDDSMYVFTVIVQLGAILSVLVIFRNQLYSMILNCIPNIFDKNHYASNHLCIQHIIIGTLPGVLFGIFLYKQTKFLFFDSVLIVYGLVLGGFFILIGEYFLFKSKKSLYCLSDINQITYLQSFLIGCFQCLAFFPGFSRSGATIGGGLMVGLNRCTSLKFSFFLAVPIISGSTVVTMYHHEYAIINMDNLSMLIISCVVAFVVSIVVMKFIFKIIQRISLVPFAIYRFLLAFIIIIYDQR